MLSQCTYNIAARGKGSTRNVEILMREIAVSTVRTRQYRVMIVDRLKDLFLTPLSQKFSRRLFRGDRRVLFRSC